MRRRKRRRRRKAIAIGDLGRHQAHVSGPAARNEDRLHPLHVGHHRPRQGRAAHGARHVVGDGRLLGPITGLTETDTVFSPLPLFHSYALDFSVLTSSRWVQANTSWRGSRQPKRKPVENGESSGSPRRADHVPLSAAGRAENGEKFNNLRLCVSAGAIMPATLNREFGSARCTLLDGYGITETSTMVTMNWPAAAVSWAHAAYPCRARGAHRRISTAAMCRAARKAN